MCFIIISLKISGVSKNHSRHNIRIFSLPDSASITLRIYTYRKGPTMISNLIRWSVSIGINRIIYWAFMGLAFVAALIYNLVFCKRVGVSRPKALALTLTGFVISYFWMCLVTWIETGFETWGGINLVRIFIWVPLLIWPFTKLFKVDWKSWCDFAGPSTLCLIQGIAHYGCLFAGCCHGYRAVHGIWNPQLDYNTFPIQIIEAVVALAIAIFLFIRLKKRNYKTDGSAYALMMILFGSTRFVLEFFRDNNKLFLGLSDLALHALFMTIVGCAVLFSIFAKEERHRKTA